MNELDPFVIGIVDVELSALSFIGGREEDPAIVAYLVEIFRKSKKGCEREIEKNYVPAIVNEQELDSILHTNHLTREDLQRTVNNNRNRRKILLPNFKLRCMHGKHRILAGKRVLEPSDAWWTVELYCFDTRNGFPAAFILKEEEKFSHETKFSDGEVYRKIRFYQQRNEPDSVQHWMLRLSKCKRLNIQMLLERPNFVRRLDKLLDFPGLLSGLELGNIRKHFAEHVPEHILYNWKHIYKVWKAITLRLKNIRCAADILTVRKLELRAPSVSVVDRSYIAHGMDSGEFFPSISDRRTRDAIKQAIMDLKEIIPTIKSFHKNMDYLRIGAKIIRSHVFNDTLPQATVFQSMQSIWARPEQPLVECRGGEFQPLDHYQDDKLLYVLYLQVFVSAIRDFPDLSYDAPRRDVRKVILRGTPDPGYRLKFLERVRLSGFCNEMILNVLSQSVETPMREQEPVHASAYDGEAIERRMGRPFSKAFNRCRQALFLPNLIQAKEEVALYPSAMFVQQDFLEAFFRYSSYFVNYRTISHPVAQASNTWGFPSLVAAPNGVEHDNLASIPAHLAFVANVETHTSGRNSPPRTVMSGAIEPNSTDTLPHSSASERLEQVFPLQAAIPIAPCREPEVAQISRHSPGIVSSENMSPHPMVQTALNRTQEFAQMSSQPSQRPLTQSNTSRVATIPSSSSTLVQGFGSPRNAAASPGTVTESERSPLLNVSPASPPRRISTSPSVQELSSRLRYSGIASEAEETVDRSDCLSAPNPPPENFHDIDDEYDFVSDASTLVEDEDLEELIEGKEPSQNASDGLLHQGHRSYLQPTTRLHVARGVSMRRSYLRAGRTIVKDPGASRVAGTPREAFGRKRSYLAPKSRPPLETKRARAMQDHRSFLLPKTRTLQPDSPSSKRLLGSMNFANQQVQPRALARPFAKTADGLFPAASASKIAASRSNQGRRSFLQPQKRDLPKEGGDGCKFIEFNGMKKSFKFTTSMSDYLQQRKGWVGMIIENKVAKTIRFDHIVRYITEGNLHQGKTLALVKAPYAEQFRVGLAKAVDLEMDDDTRHGARHESKRLKT